MFIKGKTTVLTVNLGVGGGKSSKFKIKTWTQTNFNHTGEL